MNVLWSCFNMHCEKHYSNKFQLNWKVTLNTPNWIVRLQSNFAFHMDWGTPSSLMLGSNSTPMSSLKLQEQLDALAFPLHSHLNHDPIMTPFMSLLQHFIHWHQRSHTALFNSTRDYNTSAIHIIGQTFSCIVKNESESSMVCRLYIYEEDLIQNKNPTALLDGRNM